MRGVRLLLTHPEVACRDCDDCCKYLYEENGQVRQRGGRLVEWPKGMGPDCRTCPKCQGSERPSPEVGRKATLSPRNLACISAYWEHKASPGPLDSVARRNFGTIGRLLAQHDRGQCDRLLELMRMLLRR